MLSRLFVALQYLLPRYWLTSRGAADRSMVSTTPLLRGRISPLQGVEMLPTFSAPTSTTTIGPKAVSKCRLSRSLRLKSPGT